MQHITNANYPNQVIHGAYYPHIDGIRAFAVLPVVLFHVLACLCPGGYAGVDVFFVISGYLITGGILRDLARGRFTIRDFYHRRIRRILPAYFTVVAAVFVFGCAVYHALPLMRLADATIMGSLFVANQYLWNVGGDYFSADIHTNPLLHLWSLSVEEQFYLFIPVIGLLVWKFRRNWLLPLLAAVAVLSLGWALYAMASGKEVMAFYVLPLRAWELLAGSLLAFTVARGGTPDAPAGATVKIWGAMLAAAGLLLVLVPYVFYSQTTRFPGAAALPSVIGTALLIRYGAEGWVGQLLAWRPLILVGKMSYSLYLWHWPVVVYWKYMVYDRLYAWDYAGMLALSFLLAFLSWRFVEIPVRTSPKWTMRRSFAFAAAGIVLLVGIGVACVFSKGWHGVLHPKANEMLVKNDLNFSFVEKLAQAKIKRIGRAFGYEPADGRPHIFLRRDNKVYPLGDDAAAPELLLMGDSHAASLDPGLDALLRERKRGGRVVVGCGRPLFVMGQGGCSHGLAVLSESPTISTVVLVQAWSGYMHESGRYAELEAFAAHVVGSGKRLFIVSDVPGFAENPIERLTKEKIIGARRLPTNDYARQTVADYERQQGKINRRFEEICRKTGAVFVPMHQAMRDGNYYVTTVEQGAGIIALYRDGGHISLAGAMRAARFLMPYLFPNVPAEK